MDINNKIFFKLDLQELNNISSHYTSCTFDNCFIGKNNDINNLEHISNIKFSNCTFLYNYICVCLLKNIEFDTIKFIDYGRFMSTFFHHVTFKGKFNSFSILDNGLVTDKYPEIQLTLDRFRQNFYQNIDWAIDISEAKLSEFYCNSIPSHLIIRDPETQFLVSKNKFDSLDLLDKDFKENFSYLTYLLENFLQSSQEDTIIATPLAKPKNFREPIYQGLKELKKLNLID